MITRNLFGLLMLLAAVTPPAEAQCRLCSAPTEAPTAETAPPVKLQVDTNLDFDRLVLANAGSGSAVLSPDGSRQASGAVLTVGGRAMVGTVTVHGEPGRNVRIGLPGAIILYSLDGGQVRIDSLQSDLAALPRIGANGVLVFHFGGALHVSNNSDGDFRGDFQIDVDYL